MKFLHKMVNLNKKTVVDTIINVVEDINKLLKIGAEINESCIPGNFFASQVLVDLTPNLEEALGITIPLKEYIFFDKIKHRQLTIKEATEKLIKIAKNGK